MYHLDDIFYIFDLKNDWYYLIVAMVNLTETEMPLKVQTLGGAKVIYVASRDALAFETSSISLPEGWPPKIRQKYLRRDFVK